MSMVAFAVEAPFASARNHHLYNEKTVVPGSENLRCVASSPCQRLSDPVVRSQRLGDPVQEVLTYSLPAGRQAMCFPSSCGQKRF